MTLKLNYYYHLKSNLNLFDKFNIVEYCRLSDSSPGTQVEK